MSNLKKETRILVVFEDYPHVALGTFRGNF